MSLRVLIVAGLRVYAVYNAMQFISILPFMIQMVSGDAQPSRVWGDVLSVLSLLIAAAVLWFLAEPIAGAIVGKSAPAIDRFALTLQDAYTFAFVFLGLYFVLSSIASTAAQLYFIVTIASHMPEGAPERMRALFDIYKPGITLVAGFASLVGAPIWSRKLMART